jgi:hypothetical protein
MLMWINPLISYNSYIQVYQLNMLKSLFFIISLMWVKQRAGLRVVPEWSYERQWEAHFSAQAQSFLTLVHL